MDDFVIANLHESKNEWCSRLVSIFSPLVIEGIKSLFEEAWKMCVEKDEIAKYLMTFQNLLGRVPKWNSVIIEEEKNRIIRRSGCNYLEDLISCVHIIQLKVLTCIRVGNKQKKIDISIPRLDIFIHKIYIHVARKIYSNVYLFDKQVQGLQIQRNNRELEIIVQECIMTTIRESIPTEEIIRAYMDESVEHEEEITFEPSNMDERNELKENMLELSQIREMEKDVKNEIEKEHGIVVDNAEVLKEVEKENEKEKEKEKVVTEVGINNVDEKEVVTRLTFNDYDSVLNGLNVVDSVNAPKTIERLESISTSNAIQRKLNEAENDANDSESIRIHEDELLDVGSIDFVSLSSDTDPINLDIETL